MRIQSIREIPNIQYSYYWISSELFLQRAYDLCVLNFIFKLNLVTEFLSECALFEHVKNRLWCDFRIGENIFKKMSDEGDTLVEELGAELGMQGEHIQMNNNEELVVEEEIITEERRFEDPGVKKL